MRSNYKMRISKNHYKDIDCHIKYGGNSNILVIGSSGSGKTENVVVPVLADDFSKDPVTFAVQDCKGQLYKRLKSKFIKEGYDVYNLDFTNPSVSNCFNPLEYVHNMEDARKIVKPLVVSQVHSARDPYWECESIEFLSSSIMFLKENFRKEDVNFLGLYNFLECFGTDYNTVNGSDEDSFRDMTDVFFAECDDDVPDYVRKQNKKVILDMFYSKLQKINSCDGSEYSSILLGYYHYPYRTFFSIFAVARTSISIFASKNIKRIMNSNNEFNLNRIANRKSILFINPSDTSRIYDPIVNIFYTICFQKVIKIADKMSDGRLKIPFRFIFDDFASGTNIQDFDKIISNIRSRNISCTIIIQSISQLESIYGDNTSRTIISNCSTLLYLGSNDYMQELEIARRLNKKYEDIHLLEKDKLIIFEDNKLPVIDYKNDYINCDFTYNKKGVDLNA